MASTEKTKQVLTKIFRVERDQRNDEIPPITNADPFIEPEPTVREFIEEITPSLRDVGRYFYHLFPFLSWITKYNLTWGLGDLIAGMLSLPVSSDRIRLLIDFTRRNRRRRRRTAEYGLRNIGQPRT